MDGEEWYLVERGQQVGPMDRAAVLARLRRPGYGPDTLVWTATMTDWAAAGSTALAPLLGRGAPPPPVGAAIRTAEEAPSVATDPIAAAGPAPDRWVPFGEAFRRFWQKFAVLQGRASRSEYWWAVLALVLISLVLAVVETGALGRADGLASGLFSLVTLVPSITVGVRRLHDTDRSGWWMLIGFVPIAGAIWLLVLLCLPSQPGANRFGR